MLRTSPRISRGAAPRPCSSSGKDPDVLRRAAEKCQRLGADIVDLNMGCPMPRITGKGKGAASCGRDRHRGILRSMRAALSVPLTIKIRGGWDDEHLNAVEVAQMAEAEGVDAITVHPRTRAQRHSGKAPVGHHPRRWWPRCALPVTGNGDVRSMAERAPDGGGDGLPVGDGRPRRLGRTVALQRDLRRPPPRGPARLQAAR